MFQPPDVKEPRPRREMREAWRDVQIPQIMYGAASNATYTSATTIKPWRGA